MKEIFILLVLLAALLVSFAGGAFFLNSTTYKIKYSVKRFNDYDSSLEVSGILVPTNFTPNKYPHYLILCQHESKSCEIIYGPVFWDDREVRMEIFRQDTPQVLQYDDRKILLYYIDACREEHWTIARASKTVRVESKSLTPEQQRGDCSFGSNEARSAFIGDSKDLSEWLEMNK